MPSIVGGLDIHRKQITFDYLDLVTGEVKCGHIAPADREHFRGWLARLEDPAGVAFAVEACTGWRYVTEKLRRAGIQAHLAEPADTAAARGRKKRAKTDRADARLMRDLLAQGRLPECWIAPGPAGTRPGRHSGDVRRRLTGSRGILVVALYPARHQQPDPQTAAKDKRRRSRRPEGHRCVAARQAHRRPQPKQAARRRKRPAPPPARPCARRPAVSPNPIR